MKGNLGKWALLLAVWGIQAGLGSAQDSVRVINAGFEAADDAPVTTPSLKVAAPVANCGPMYDARGRGVGQGYGQGRQPVRTLVHDHGYCCGVDPGFVGCTNFHESLLFIFGSCRTFFGEQCQPRQPGSCMHPYSPYGH